VTYAKPEPITLSHELSNFRCGDDRIDRWLRDHAVSNAIKLAGSVRVVSVSDTREVVAFYALSHKVITGRSLPGRMRRNMPPEIPAVFIGQFAVALDHQGSGLGKALLKDMFNRIVHSLAAIPAPLIALDAANEEAARFWRHWGFRPYPDLMDTAYVMRTVDLLASMGLSYEAVLEGLRD
jgi:GNAT superfamily N-acetyltransferase